MTFKYYEHEEWKAFSVELTKIACEKRGIRQKQGRLMNQVKTLQLAEDLTMRKKWDFEGMTSAAITTLEETTGQCDDCWWSDYQAAEEEIEQMRIAKCVEVAALESQYGLLTDKYKTIDKEQDACRDRLIAENLKNKAKETDKEVMKG